MFAQTVIFPFRIIEMLGSKLLRVTAIIHDGFLKADPHIACRAHAIPLPCRAAKALECVFPI